MLKKIIIVLVILAVIVIGALIYALSNANSIVTKYKPQIEEQLSKTLNTNLTLGNLDVSVFPETKIKIDELRVSKSKDAKGFVLNNFNLIIKLLPVLLEQKLVISELLIDSPNIEFIQTKTGIQIAGLESDAKKTKEVKVAKKDPIQEKDIKKEPQAEVSSPIGLALESFRLVDANITLFNKDNNTKQHIERLNIESALNFEKDTAILSNIKGSAKLLKQFNFTLGAKSIKFAINSGVAKIDNLEVGIDKNKIAINTEVNSKELSGSGVIQVKSLEHVVGPIKVSDGSGKLPFKLNKGAISISTNDLKFLVNKSPIGIKLNAYADQKIAKLGKLAVSSFGGVTELDGVLNLKDNMKFGGNLKVNEISIEDAGKTFAPNVPLSLTGTIKNIDGEINGNLGAKDLLSSLGGRLILLIEDGELKGSNIAGEVLNALSQLPFVKGPPLESLSEEEKKLASSPNTALDLLAGDFIINGSTISTRNLKLKSTLFDLNGAGKFDLVKECNFDTDIIFSYPVSRALGQVAKEVRDMQNDQGRLPVPLVLKGKLSSLKVLPNMEKLIAQGAKAVIKNKARKAIGNIFKKKGGGNLLGF